MRHKTILLPITLICASILWTGCSREAFTEQSVKELDSAHTVTLEAVSRLATAMARGDAATKAEDFQQPEIIPIVDIYKDTLFYAVNFFPGWKLISSDKRTPIVLAENEQGEFSLEDMKDYGAGAWLECMAQDLRAVKESPDWKLPGIDNELYFEDFWNSLSPAETKSNDGYYELYSTQVYEEGDQIIEHLTTTRWDQEKPYNWYCPLKSNSEDEHVPAGCVAVAGAQMLYYLHNKIGRPELTPSAGVCYGHAPNNYYQDFSSFSNLAWNNFHDRHTEVYFQSPDTCINEALLIGYIGNSIGIQYTDERSRSDNSNLSNFINTLGISCQYDDYDEDVVSQSLLDSIPVIAGAISRRTILGIPIRREGHSFLIDGFMSSKKKYHQTYVKYNPVVYQDTTDMNYVVYEPDFNDTYVMISESSPYISKIKMNWGFNELFIDDAWYTMTGNWHVEFIDDVYNFDYDRDMIYNFQAL